MAAEAERVAQVTAEKAEAAEAAAAEALILTITLSLTLTLTLSNIHRRQMKPRWQQRLRE